MAKYYDKKIDKNVDWGGDASTGNLPVVGERVQEFIKEQLEKRAGVFYHDVMNSRYLAFADSDNLEVWLNDKGRNDLVLGVIEAGAAGEKGGARINLISPMDNAVKLGSTGHFIEFTFETTNANGQPTGESVMCTYTIRRGSNRQTVTEQYVAGKTVRFNVDKYLQEGTNTVSIQVQGVDTWVSTTLAVTYQVVNLVIGTGYDISRVYNLMLEPESVADIAYTIEGTGTKMMEWYLDGEQLAAEAEDEVVEYSAARTKYISLAGLAQGVHNVQMRAYVVLDGERFHSDVVYMDVIVYTAADREPMVALKAVIPSEEGIQEELTLHDVVQYVPYEFDFAVFNARGAASTDVEMSVSEQVLASVQAKSGEVYRQTIRVDEAGNKVLKIKAEGTVREVPMVVAETDMTIGEITEGLVLNLSAMGRNNDDAQRDSWESGGYESEFIGLRWNATSGWNDNRLVLSDGDEVRVNMAPFGGNATDTGMTLEMEFGTDDVDNDDAVICDLRASNGRGMVLTASNAELTSAGGAKVATRYKSGENIRVSFVVNKATGTTNKGLVFVYIDGILSGAETFAENDNFISDAMMTIGGTTEAIVRVKQIMVYNRALGSDEVLNNYMLYRDNGEEMLEAYERNNILDGNALDLDALASQCPVLKVTGDIPTLEATTNKDETIYVDVEYVNMQHPNLSFTGTHMTMKPQGTSSMGYPKKNFRLYTRKHDDTKIYNAEGQEIKDRLYAFTQNAQPVDCWCFKADYAESSGTHNTGVARLWNKVMFDAQIGGEYKLRTTAQQKAVENGYKYDVRTTVDGFPCHIVYRLNEQSAWIYIGKYNFNNDKSTESVFGFVDIPGFDNSRMQCWEVLNNGNHLALFEDVNNFDTEWKDAYESRYPDTKTPNTADLKAFCQWVVSTKGNVEKFKTEKWEHLDVYKAAAYYVYVMRFGAVDQTVKNSMLTSEDGEHFYWINYDNDTINGLRNDGLLAFDYLIDRQSKDPNYTEQVYVYAGHSSTLWNNMEADDEFMRVVQEVDQALYTAGLSYANTIRMFDEEQSAKWCERVYNRDAQYKYISPFADKGTNNLFMLQGARRAQRRWWLSHRFDLIDSRFISGKFKASIVDFKVMNDTPIGQEFSIVAGNQLYYGYGVNDIPAETGVKLDKGDEYTFVTKQVLNIGDPVRIYSAQNIREIDLSKMMSRLTQLGVAGVWSEENGSQLKRLVLGDGVSVNSGLTEISGLPQAQALEELDVRGCVGMTSLNIGSIKTLKKVLAQGSGLTSFAPAEGAMLEEVHLPSGLTGLTLKGLAYLEALNVENAGRQLATIQVSDCPKITNNFAFFKNWNAVKATENRLCRVELDGVMWENVAPADLIALGQIKKDGGVLKLKGKIVLTETSEEIVDELRALFGDTIFEPNAELHITGPAAIYLSGPSELLEGNSAQYVAAVFGGDGGRIEWSIVGGSTSGEAIDQYGLLRTSYTGVARSITIQAKYTPDAGDIVSVQKDVNVLKQVRPTGAIINGANYAVNGSEYTLTVSPSGINTEYSVAWRLSGEAYDNGYVSIKNQTQEKCVLSTVKGGTGNVTIEAIITDVDGNTVTVSKTVSFGVTLTVKMMSNQDGDTTLDSLKATVIVDGVYNSVVNGGTIVLAAGTVVSISFPSVNGYRKPDTQEFVTGSENLTKTGVYQTEVVIVSSVTTNDGAVSTIGVTVSINGKRYAWNGSAIRHKVPFGTAYIVTASSLSGYKEPKKSFTAEIAERSVELVYSSAGSRITLNQNITDPSTMISGDINGKHIQLIRQNSHRYLGKYTEEGTMTVCQLDDADSTRYIDGTVADLTGSEGDVFMKLPRFWYQAVETEINKWDIGFFYGTESPGDDWKEWDGTELIGVYEAYSIDSKVYSRSGVDSSVKISQQQFKEYARNRGSGYSIVKWKHHNIMAFLYYAMYGHMNSQEQIGSGTDSFKATGQTDNLGMVDTVAGVNGNNQSINFWGLEYWWGNKYEFIDNIVVNNLTWNITEDDGSTRTFSGNSSEGYISRVVVGEHLDMICIYTRGSETTGFCDYCYIRNEDSMAVCRSCFLAPEIGGVAFVNITEPSSVGYNEYSSRLAFKGRIVEAESVRDYQNLIAIG